MKHNFFLYAVHFAIVRLINKTAARLGIIGATDWYGPFFLFLFMPVLVLVISSVTGAWMRRYLPRVWRLLTGDR